MAIMHEPIDELTFSPESSAMLEPSYRWFHLLRVISHSGEKSAHGAPRRNNSNRVGEIVIHPYLKPWAYGQWIENPDCVQRAEFVFVLRIEDGHVEEYYVERSSDGTNCGREVLADTLIFPRILLGKPLNDWQANCCVGLTRESWTYSK